MSYKLHHGDCIPYMKTLPNGFFDLTVTSPPYDNLRTYGKDFDADEFDWHSIIKELYRITAVGGVVAWVVADATIKGSETGTSFRQALWAMECGFRLHDTMFYYTEKPPLSHNRYEQKIEYMFVFAKGRPKATNLIREASIYFGIDKRKGGVYTHNSGYNESKAIRNGAKRSSPNPTKIKSHMWKYNTGASHGEDPSRYKHPATFPSALARDHIISWSNVGDKVFDPMMGSGTVGVESAKLKRPFYGCELDAGYFADAEIRIKNAANEFTPTAKEKASGQMALWGK